MGTCLLLNVIRNLSFGCQKESYKVGLSHLEI